VGGRRDRRSTTDETYGAGGAPLARYTGDANSRSFVPVGGGLLAEYYCGGMIFAGGAFIVLKV